MKETSSGFFTLENGSLHYLKSGNGSRILLAFHGYGNNASLFSSFYPYLESDFTVVSFDLPHHGKSRWKENALFRKEDLKILLEKVLKEFHTEKISLAGYSMGGRVCLKIIEIMPERIDRVLLIAPDGLVFNPLYFFVTRSYFGKKIFRKFLTTPQRYLKLIDWIRSHDWIDASRYKFAMYYLNSSHDREFLLKVWPGMSLIVPDMKKLKTAIENHRIPVFIFMGIFDRVIPVEHAKRFKKGLKSVQLFVLEKGHRVFDSSSLPQMAQCLIKGIC